MHGVLVQGAAAVLAAAGACTLPRLSCSSSPPTPTHTAFTHSAAIHSPAPLPQCAIHDSFLGPAELASVYATTVLNVHPPT